MSIKEKYNEFIEKNGHEPVYADCVVRFANNDVDNYLSFKLNCELDKADDLIFYYCSGIEELISLTETSGDNEFVVTEVVDFYDEI